MSDIKWTVSIIFQFYKEDTEFFNILKEDIESHAINGSRKIKYFLLKHNELENEATSYELDENNKLEKVIQVYKTTEFYSDISFAEEMWVDFLANAKIHNNANHFLITEGHGNGFGFCTKAGLIEEFEDVEFDFIKPKKVKMDKSDLKIKKSYINFTRALQIILSHDVIEQKNYANSKKLFNSFREASFAFTSDFLNNKLKEEEFGAVPVGVLKKSIEKVFDKKLIFLYLGNCFLQTIENGFLFKDQVLYLCAAEGLYFSTGTNYKKIFEIMDNNENGPDHFKNIATAIINGIAEKFEDPRIKKVYGEDIGQLEQIRETFSFSINNLSTYEVIKNKIALLGKSLILNDNKNSIYGAINQIRNDQKQCRDVFSNPLGIIDFVNFINRLAKSQSAVPLGELIREIYDLISKTNTISFSHFPPACFNPSGKFPEKCIFPFGFSIFFPGLKVQSGIEQYINYFMDNFYLEENNLSEFHKDNQWRNFVIDFYNSTIS